MKFEDFFTEVVSEGLSKLQTTDSVDIINFAESFLFNGETVLFPTQKAILKAFYNEELNEDEQNIINDWIGEDRTTYIPGRKYSNLVFECGRRGGKTTLISIIVLYEFYKLITLESPAKHYNLLPNSPIAIFVISQSQEQVKETLFAQIVGYAKNSYFFKGLEKTGKIEILIEEIRCREKNIGVYAKHTNSRSLVGYSLKVLVLDEAARFEMDEYGKSKADDIWENVAKGCAHRNALLLTDKGYRTYGELLDNFDEYNPPRIITYDPYTYDKGITDRVSIWDNGPSITYEIKTESGKKETITPEHPLLVKATNPSWIKAKDLHVGMKVACPKDLSFTNTSTSDRTFNLDNNFYWESITSIEILPSSNTVGITVQDTGIIGNDILSHNTQTFGLEGKKIAISSAWEEGDYIEVLYDISKKHYASLGFRLATWQVNLSPQMSELSLKSSDSYIKDPIMAALEYEGIRAPKHGAFFIPSNVRTAMRGVSSLDAMQIPLTIEGQDTRHYVGVQINRIRADNSYPSFMHTDYGVKKDSAATAICHLVKLDDKWGIQVDAVLMWKPYVDKDSSNKGIKRIVSFLNVEEVLYTICSNRNIAMCTFDSYQSEYAIQKLHRSGIRTSLMSTAVQAQLSYFTLLKNLIDQNLLILPCDSPWSSMIEYELINLIQKPSGKIDHPRNSSKDLADAIANSVYNCYTYACSTGATFSSNASISFINSNKIDSNIVKTKRENPFFQTGIKNLNRYKNR